MGLEVIKGDEDAVRVALGNSVILRYVCGYLPLKDLKDCSLVSKFWNFEVRSYIRDFRECVVHIFGTEPCHRLSTLNQIISEMAVVPINSLKLSLSRCTRSECEMNKEESNLYFEGLLKKLPLKYLRIALPFYFEPDSCPAIKFLVALLSGNSKELQTLQCACVPLELGKLFDQEWTPCLPKLRVFDLGQGDAWADSIDFVIKIINGAPNLQKLKGFFYPFKLGCIPEEYYSILDHFRLTMDQDEEEERCLKLAKAGPSLSSLAVDGPMDRNYKYRRSLFPVLEQLFKSSRNSLQEFKMSGQLFPLSQLEFPALINVKKMIVVSSRYTPELFNLLETTEYSKQFPVLAQVEIKIFFHDPNEDDQLGIAPPAPTCVHTSTTVKNLKLEADAWNRLTCRRLSKIYPSVCDIEFISNSLSAIPYADLCSSWPQLQSIYLKVGIDSGDDNIDAEFLGVDPTELDLLRELDDETLEKINIAPSRPSVLALPHLKTLEIEFGHTGGNLGAIGTDSFVFSRLTGILGFRKLKEMGAYIQIGTLDRTNYYRLQHLQRYVPVMFKRRIS